MQKLRRALAEKSPDGQIPAAYREKFRAASRPLMKYTNILTFNWRSIVLFITVLAGQPWLYFVFELTVLNILLIYMVRRHEAICRSFLAALNT